MPSVSSIRDPLGRFSPGARLDHRAAIGEVRIRTRSRRGRTTRAFVKVADPNVWEPRARVEWEAANGPLPKGMVVHHIDFNELNDDINNLKALTKAEHLAIHRPFHDTAAQAEKMRAVCQVKKWSRKKVTA